MPTAVIPARRLRRVFDKVSTDISKGILEHVLQLFRGDPRTLAHFDSKTNCPLRSNGPFPCKRSFHPAQSFQVPKLTH